VPHNHDDIFDKNHTKVHKNSHVQKAYWTPCDVYICNALQHPAKCCFWV